MKASNGWTKDLNGSRKRRDVVQGVSWSFEGVHVLLIDNDDHSHFKIEMTPGEAETFARQLLEYAERVKNSRAFQLKGT